MSSYRAAGIAQSSFAILGISAFVFVFGYAASFASTTQATAQQDRQYCRQANFRGCCSWNGGLSDYRNGQCVNGTKSDTCEAKWGISLRGRCSYNEGINRVDADGIVYCNNEKAPGAPIPKCDPQAE